MDFKSIFKKDKNIIIGAIHFPPLAGYPDFPGFDIALKNALVDLIAFEEGGVDAVIIENNYDIPHKIDVGIETATCLTDLALEIKKKARVPVGISVLWNDYKTALSIAKKVGLAFVRVPVFVDDAKTDYGTVYGDPTKVINYRKSIGAENIALFTDIHVKHAEIMSKHTLTESARLAISNGADALIVTGKWTGDAPNIKDLIEVRDTSGNFPVLCGSGVDESNANNLFRYANGAIVSTSLKDGINDSTEINVKPYSSRVSAVKTKILTDKIKNSVS